LRWIAKENKMGEFKMGVFWGCGRDSTWRGWGGGTNWCAFCAFGGILLGILSCKCGWGDQLVRGFLRTKPKDELFDNKGPLRLEP
jgi:hypothetical protein